MMFAWDWLLAAAMMAPDVAARDLDGRPVHVAQLRGAPAVLALGFSYRSRHDVEAWTRWLVGETKGSLTIVVMPVYHDMPGPVRSMVDGMMARSTPAELRPRVWTTDEHEALVAGLGLPADEQGTAIVLMDALGVVRHLARGPATPASMKRLIETWRALAPGPRG